VVSGQEFIRPYKNMRGVWLMEKLVIAFAKKVVAAMELGDMDNAPHMRFPLLALAHMTNVSLPGQVRFGDALRLAAPALAFASAPPLHNPVITHSLSHTHTRTHPTHPPPQEPPIDQASEDLRLWDPTLCDKSGAPINADTRRRMFMAEKWRKNRSFSTEHVWTFYIWQQVIDVAGYYLDLVLQEYDMIQHLDGQPLQSMVRDKASGKYLFNFLYWNKRQMEAKALEAAAAGQKK